MDLEIVMEMCGYKKKRSTFWDDGSIVAKKCAECNKIKWADDFYRNSEKGLSSLCKDCTYEYQDSNRDIMRKNVKAWYERNTEKAKAKVRTAQTKRRTLEEDLPYEWDEATERKVLSRFNGGCALTGSVDVSWDHAIPVAIGHGGTTEANYYPLRSDLNSSKRDRNIFEWFKRYGKKKGVSQTKFDALIEYLAKLNGMTTKEYRDYVYWCHENPRDAAR